MEPFSLHNQYSQLFIIAKESRRRENFVSLMKSTLEIKHVAAAETFEPNHLYPITRSRWLVLIDRSLSMEEALHEIQLIRRSGSAVDIVMLKKIPASYALSQEDMPDAVLPENFTLNDLLQAVENINRERMEANQGNR